jgi:hypothetical protein
MKIFFASPLNTLSHLAEQIVPLHLSLKTLGDFNVGFSVGVCCTKCTLNTGVNTNFEITHCPLPLALRNAIMS